MFGHFLRLGFIAPEKSLHSEKWVALLVVVVGGISVLRSLCRHPGGHKFMATVGHLEASTPRVKAGR